MSKKLNVFIIEDDRIYSRLLVSYINNLSKRLSSKGISFNVITYSSGEKFFDNLSIEPHIVFLDFYLDAKYEDAQNGLQILKHLKDKYPNVYVVMMTSQEHTITTVELMKNGAIDYIPKDNNSFQRIDSVIDNICLDQEKKSRRKKIKSNALLIGAMLVFALVIYINR